MSPTSCCCFSFDTSLTTSPLRTVELFHLGSCRVEDTTYLGMLFNLSAHSPLRDAHRAAKNSSVRRPSSRAWVPSASSSRTLAASPLTAASPPNWPAQPPRRKPSPPSGSWMTPSSETLVLITIFPMSVLLWQAVSATTDAGPATPGNWAPTSHPARPWPVSLPGWNCDKVRQQRDASGELAAADLISRARAEDGDPFQALTERTPGSCRCTATGCSDPPPPAETSWCAPKPTSHVSIRIVAT